MKMHIALTIIAFMMGGVFFVINTFVQNCETWQSALAYTAISILLLSISMWLNMELIRQVKE